MIKLSLILPYYNVLKPTKALMEVLIPQLTKEVEVILIDDGCDEKELDKYPITVIHQKNKGLSGARNTGLDICKGEFVCFIDPDDMVTKDYISKIMNKIKTSTFDYCFFSWKGIGRWNKEIIIEDMPPHDNTCVWNCIYSRKLIGKKRFDETKQIAEDGDFNNRVRKGKKDNIKDILYIYDTGRPDSLTNLYQGGKISTTRPIETHIIFYQTRLNEIGGVESVIYEKIKALKDIYDIVCVYKDADKFQLDRLRRMVKCVKFNNQQFKCDYYINCNFGENIIDNVEATQEYIQKINTNLGEYNIDYKVHPKTTMHIADSEATQKSFLKKYPKEKCILIHNIITIDKPKKVLSLMSATRFSSEKGRVRSCQLAKRANELGYLFGWEVFTNIPQELFDIEDGFIFRKPRLNVTDYMWNKDYGLQLSDTESSGLTITEFLSRGIPVICTDFESAKEQVIDGVNGYILKRDMSNLDEVIKKMFTTNLKGFEFKPKGNVKQWTDLFGKMKKESNYVWDEEEVDNEPVKFIALREFKTKKQEKMKIGDEITSLSDEESKILFDRGFIKRKE